MRRREGPRFSVVISPGVSIWRIRASRCGGYEPPAYQARPKDARFPLWSVIVDQVVVRATSNTGPTG